MLEKLFKTIKESSIDIVILVGALLVLFFMPESYLDPESLPPKVGLFMTLFMKCLYVTLGFLQGHLIVHFYFSYIDFEKEKEWSNNAIIIVIYMMSMFCWARGG
jgi:hypothetical protein